MQIRQKYLNCSICKFVIYFLQHSETFDVLHVFLPLTVAELSTLKQVRFIWSILYISVNKHHNRLTNIEEKKRYPHFLDKRYVHAHLHNVLLVSAAAAAVAAHGGHS